MTDYQRLMNFKKDTMKVHQPSFSNLSTTATFEKRKNRQTHQKKITPLLQVRRAVKWCYTRFFRFKQHEYQLCHRRRDKESFVATGKPSLQIKCKKKVPNSVRGKFSKRSHQKRSNSYSVFVTLNGDFKCLSFCRKGFQFDTASDISSISRST